MFPETSVPQYWQRLCGEPLTNGHIVLEVTSQWLFIEALRQGLGVGMMAKEIVQRCCPELVNVMPAQRVSRYLAGRQSGCLLSADLHQH